jgi:hypothetical protein
MEVEEEDREYWRHRLDCMKFNYGEPRAGGRGRPGASTGMRSSALWGVPLNDDDDDDDDDDLPAYTTIT